MLFLAAILHLPFEIQTFWQPSFVGLILKITFVILMRPNKQSNLKKPQFKNRTYCLVFKTEPQKDRFLNVSGF